MLPWLFYIRSSNDRHYKIHPQADVEEIFLNNLKGIHDFPTSLNAMPVNDAITEPQTQILDLGYLLLRLGNSF